MERWIGRVAVVTGASSGIGADIALNLAKQGLKVVGLARRRDRVAELAKSLPQSTIGKIYPLECSVCDESQVHEAFNWVEKNVGPVSVLINNAGLTRLIPFEANDNTKGWEEILNTNVLGLSFCTRYALQSMRRNQIDDGHFININSIVGHMMPNPQWPGSAMYFASKHAVTVLTDGLRKEVVTLKTNIRVTSLSPGVVKSEFMAKYMGDEVYDTMPYLEPEHISDACIYILSAPPNVNISEMTIKPTGEEV